MTLPMSTAKFSERQNEKSYFRSENQLDCALERTALNDIPKLIQKLSILTTLESYRSYSTFICSCI